MWITTRGRQFIPHVCHLLNHGGGRQARRRRRDASTRTLKASKSRVTRLSSTSTKSGEVRPACDREATIHGSLRCNRALQEARVRPLTSRDQVRRPRSSIQREARDTPACLTLPYAAASARDKGPRAKSIKITCCSDSALLFLIVFALFTSLLFISLPTSTLSPRPRR